MEAIDEEVVSILTEASQRATQLLEEKNEALVDLTRALIDSEELDRFAIEKVIGPSVHQPPATKKSGDDAAASEGEVATDDSDTTEPDAGEGNADGENASVDAGTSSAGD